METLLPPVSAPTRVGILHLQRFWKKTALKRSGQLPQNAFLEEWATDQSLMNALGIGLEPTISYLYQEAPDFETFENWILEKTGGVNAEIIREFNEMLEGQAAKSETADTGKVLTEEDIRFFNEHGYLIIRNAVSDAESQAAQDAVWEFLGYDANNPGSWYEIHPERKGIMVQLFHHPALEKTRRSEKIRRIFAELFGHDKLFVTTDRVSFNPPENDRWTFPGPNLHWDVSIKQPIPFALQGLLYLTDTRADQGAFTLVPGFQNSIGEWLEKLPEGTNPRNAILDTPDAKPLAANRGDFIVWHQALPHGSRPNTSDFPRIVQYITWQEIDQPKQEEWM